MGMDSTVATASFSGKVGVTHECLIKIALVLAKIMQGIFYVVTRRWQDFLQFVFGPHLDA